ncbi:MAG: sigma-70 family RNA polymerase sigma factor [Planctomycetota bacterium]
MRPTADQNALDWEVIQRVVRGEVDAFEILLDRHTQRVFEIVSRHAPADRVPEIAHETFVQAYLSLKRYRPTGPFSGWLATIAFKRCSDHWRRTYRERPSRESPHDAGPDPAAEREATQTEMRELLDWALEQLGTEDRIVLTMEYLEGLGVRECARTLGWSEAKVKVRAHRARKRLRQVLEEQEP